MKPHRPEPTIEIGFDEQGRFQDPAVRAQVEKYITDFAQFVVRVMAALIFVVGFVESARVQAAPQTERRTVAARRMNDEEIIELDGRLDEGPWKRAVPDARPADGVEVHVHVPIRALGGTRSGPSLHPCYNVSSDLAAYCATCWCNEPFLTRSSSRSA